jgi:lysophospholipase L1-like esterase
MRRILLAVLMLMPLLAHAEKPRTILAAIPISRMDLPWWKKRHEAKLAEVKQTRPELVFLGDSITEDWEYSGPPAWQDFVPVWNRFYAGRKAVNLGFKGDTTASLLWRINNGEVTGYTPKVAVILIGANNFGRVHWSAEDTAAGIEAIIKDLRRRQPKLKILLVGVLPSDRSAWVTEMTATLNRSLAARYASGDQATFIDTSHVFMKNGRLDHSLFYDGRKTPPEPALHPTAQGQALMAAAIEPTLAAMLGDTPRQ